MNVADEHSRSLWMSEAPVAETAPLASDAEADVAVVGNDACWNAEHQIQLRAYGGARAHGLDLLPTQYGSVAAALGAQGADVSTAEALASALQRFAAAGKPALVNVMIERAAAPRY